MQLTARMARVMVGGALAAALILAIAHGAEKGSTWYLKAALIIALVCVAIGEFLSWHNAATAYHERRLGSLALWSLLGGVLTVGTLYTNFSSSAGNNNAKASVQKTAFVTQEDTSKTEAELTARNNDLLQRISMAPKRTAEQAEAAIVNAKANRFWNLTNGCTETKGPQTRAFCDAYASAVADKAGALALITDREEQKQVAAQLLKIREARSSTVAVVAADQASVVTLASMTNIDIAIARQADAMVVPLLVQAMLLFGGILLANESFRGKQRLSWIDGPKWMARLNNLIAACGGNPIGRTTTIITDKEAETKIREAARASLGKYAAAH